jgi:hypothetical protein
VTPHGVVSCVSALLSFSSLFFSYRECMCLSSFLYDYASVSLQVWSTTLSQYSVFSCAQQLQRMKRYLMLLYWTVWSSAFVINPQKSATTTTRSRSRQRSQLFSSIQEMPVPTTTSTTAFNLTTALFCGGLAFDSYTEPPKDSSRWERGVRRCVMPLSLSLYLSLLYSCHYTCVGIYQDVHSPLSLSLSLSCSSRKA